MTAWMRAVGVSMALIAGACLSAPAFAATQDTTLAMPAPAAGPVNTTVAMPMPARATTLPPATMPVPVTLPQISLHDRVISFVDFGNQDTEEQCLATAVYFEARGETLEGQLAVAQVILNRSKSGRYPPTICGVVTQPAQFSFVRGGQLPSADRKDECWHKALAIADVALKNEADALPSNVLWYHATYVDPRWNRTMTRTVQIGSHIFYS